MNKSIQLFQQRMQALLGTELEIFLESLAIPVPKTIRWNPLLVESSSLSGTPVPWNPVWGRYWNEETLPGQTAAYALGHYYIQEASAMLAVAAATQVQNLHQQKVLDLCAAPGGKTTQIGEQIGNGYVVANEFIQKRTFPLMWNLVRHRLTNGLVCSLSPRILAKHLPSFFDVVFVDAPCSGEGLFARNKHSLEKWSLKEVRNCAKRQRSILKHAAQLLKPNGMLVYSTCTFATEENEEQTEFCLQHGFSPIPFPDSSNHFPELSPGISSKSEVQLCSRRIFPHREGGAGAYVSLMRKIDSSLDSSITPTMTITESDPYAKMIQSFDMLNENTLQSRFIWQKNRILSAFSVESIPTFLWENALQIGQPLYNIHQNKWMHGAVPYVGKQHQVELDDQQLHAYLRGESFAIHHPDGYVCCCTRQEPLGWAQIINHQAQNQFPRAFQLHL